MFVFHQHYTTSLLDHNHFRKRKKKIRSIWSRSTEFVFHTGSTLTLRNSSAKTCRSNLLKLSKHIATSFCYRMSKVRFKRKIIWWLVLEFPGRTKNCVFSDNVLLKIRKNFRSFFSEINVWIAVATYIPWLPKSSNCVPTKLFFKKLYHFAWHSVI